MDVLINREKELKILAEAWDSERPGLIIITGRKRVGKTRLLEEFLKGKEGIFHCAEDKESKFQVKDLFMKVTDGRNADIPGQWREMFNYLSKVLPTGERYYLVIEEFCNLIKRDKWVVLNFQKFWDKFAVNTRLLIVLTGSNTGIMDKNTISPDSLLYGRKTAVVNIRGLDFMHSHFFLNRMPLIDKVKVYLSLGGIVDYLKRAEQFSCFKDFKEEELENDGSFFQKEVAELLDRELGNDTITRVILSAVALGNNSPRAIAKYLKSENRKIHPHINKLVHREFLQKITPFNDRETTSRYFIKDVLVDYWLNRIQANKSDQSKLLIDDYYQKRFKIFIREEISQLYFNCHNSGPFWG
ncbi:MAG: AAA family ATPase, partial [Candidatus Hodarchaeales archaeon]